MKKALAILLSILLLAACVPLGAIPVMAATSGTTGDCTWTLDDSGHLTISGNGAMEDYDYWDDYYAPWGMSITSVTIEDGVTTIGDFAFNDCTALISVTIPDSVIAIGRSAFSDCSHLTSITIPDSVTTIRSWVFNNCTSLASVTIGNRVTTIGIYAFADCVSLTSVTIPNSVISIDVGVFSGCTSLTAIAVDSNNLNYVSLDGVLFNKEQTALIQYPGGKSGNYITPDSVTTIGDSAFSSCTSLTSLTIPDSVTTIGDSAFYGCTSLTSVTIPDSVTTIGYGAFSYCDSLTSVTIGDSVTTIGNCAFEYCDALTSVTIPDSVTTIGYMAFSDCDSLTSVTIGDGVTTIGSHAFYGCSSLMSVAIGDSVTTIGYMAFSFCFTLTSVTIPDSVTTIGSYAFAYCSSLTSVTIGDGVTTIGDSAFERCTSLTNVYYGGDEAWRASISIKNNNSPLISATWHYNICIHRYTDFCDHDCNKCGEIREAPHFFDNAYDHDCNECGFVRFAYGDANGDGKVNNQDLGRLQQYLNEWDVEIPLLSMDVDGNDRVNNKDLGLLQRYLNGWDVTLGPDEPDVPDEPSVVLPEVGYDLDGRGRIFVKEISRQGNVVTVTLENISGRWMTEETSYVEYTCTDAEGNVLTMESKYYGILYFGILEAKEVDTFTFNIPTGTTKVEFGTCHVVYWTQWS